MNKKDEERFERAIRVARFEEQNRICGMIEFYIGALGDTSGERSAKKILEHVIKTIEHNEWKRLS